MYIDESLQGKTIQELLENEMHLTKREIRGLKFDPPGIRLNGRQARVTERVKAGDILEASSPRSTMVRPEEGELDILYEDEALLIVNKPAGLVVHPSPDHLSGTLANFVEGYYRRTGQPWHFHTAGRLDKETSGLIVFPKSAWVQEKIRRLQEDGQWTKTYLAVATGRFEQEEGEIDQPLSASGRIRKMQADPEGLSARTRWKVLRQYEDRALLICQIESGRMHQIRAHLNSIGHPLLGDTFYGGQPEGIARTALHCRRLEGLHPFTGELLVVEAPLPADFQNVASA